MKDPVTTEHIEHRFPKRLKKGSLDEPNADMIQECQNCKTTVTPLWRRDNQGNSLCNACGLFLKLHGRARPTCFKTNVIKPRNRVKGSSNLSKYPSPHHQSPPMMPLGASTPTACAPPHPILPHPSPAPPQLTQLPPVQHTVAALTSAPRPLNAKEIGLRIHELDLMVSVSRSRIEEFNALITNASMEKQALLQQLHIDSISVKPV